MARMDIEIQKPDTDHHVFPFDHTFCLVYICDAIVFN